MRLVNQNDRIGPWVILANGQTQRLSKGMKLPVETTRAIVVASNPQEATNAAAAESFSVGIRNATKDEPAELAIYGEIGNPWEMSDAASVGQFLRSNKGKSVNVRINSPGGLAYDGITIHNALLNHDGPVTTIIEGMAGSAASIIAVAGNPAKIYENANLFIHRGALVAIGNRDIMQEAIDWLDQLDEAIARTYKAKTGKAFDKIMDWMIGNVDGTVFSARDAVANKFCDETVPLKKNNGTNAKPMPSSDDGIPQSAKFVELARAIRMRSRSELFVPAASILSPIKKPKADDGTSQMFDVGDMVEMDDDGTMIECEIVEVETEYVYDVKASDGTVYKNCCEDELTIVSEEEDE